MKVALVGIGKIAVDQHVPSIAASDEWDLDATVSRSGTVDGVTSYTEIDTMLAENLDINVVSLCLPPVPRFDYAAACIRAGRHVMLEKPPGATVAEVHALQAMAEEAGVVLFATWHSRMAKGVAAAKAALTGKTIETAHIDWKEDVRKWHPGQDWVWEPGGMGVLDPGINALSILTEILPAPVHLRRGIVQVPRNRQTPVAAELSFTGGVTASFDWLKQGEQLWEMTLTATDGTAVQLKEGGNRCIVDGADQSLAELGEYPALYARMADLVRKGQSDVDLAPMVHVSDIMTLCERETVDAFEW
ncbi:Gfo/Idh/MocA family protein [Pseudooctadecabacter jejudonensis]|uniref:L-arabinose 1-dehydrogenase n=1 Tax=Pseudooctadecabacter jejudonensis TaxID=1391910 RepID=A0A1Y5S5G6_9RHOB|nr:Gfo/Idh/MocA family oxidoreductase [Pseudooctadecabacter jejudonensis]SLN33006.1 L-arabinose 1-dehydrogenase [Pseudooctadecabacter jejudonensis]